MSFRHWIVIAALLAIGCQRYGSPELLIVSAVLPSEMQLGGGVRVIGEGFALGRPVSVTLRGRVHRPGRAAARVSLRLPAASESAQELSFSIPRTLQAELCGEPDQASHATFRGDVEVAIAAKRPGTPPVIGTLHGAVLELYPASKTEAAETTSRQLGRHMLEFLGLELRSTQSGLAVVAVAPSSRAAEAELLPGDLLVNAGGVSVLEASDLVPEPTRRIELTLARDGDEHTHWVDVDGFASTPPDSVSQAGVLVGALAIGFGLLGGPWSGAFLWLEHNCRAAWSRARGARASGAGFRASGLPRPKLGLSSSAWLALLLVVPLLVAPRVARAFDALLWLLVALLVTRLVLAGFALLHGGKVGGRRWSLVQGTRAALHELLALLPGLAALGLGLSESGLSLARVVGRQGAEPWAWAAFASPARLLLFLVFVLSALPVSRSSRHPAQLLAARPQRVASRAGSPFPSWVNLFAVSALAAWVFLGGDRLPEFLSQSLAPVRLQAVLGASVLLLKFALVSAFVCLLRSAASEPSAQDVARITYRSLPLALGLLALERLWLAAVETEPLWRWVASGFGAAAVTASVFILVILGLRARGRCLAPAVSQPISPWL